MFIVIPSAYTTMQGKFSKENAIKDIKSRGLSSGMLKELLETLETEWQCNR